MARAIEAATPKIRSRKDGAAVALDDLDRKLLNLMQGSFPLEPRPYGAVAALAYLDVIAAVRAITRLPVAAYNVSGEYAMVKAAAASGAFDERAVVLETLTAIRRAGADIIITYHAEDAARWLSE